MGIGAADASMQVDDAGQFPAIGADDHFYVVLDAGVRREIVKVVSRNQNVFGIERGQDGTQAQAFLQGTLVDLRPVAIALEELRQSGGRDDAQLAEFIRDTMATAMRSSPSVVVTVSDDHDTFTFTTTGQQGGGRQPEAYQRRAGISVDGDVSAAELIAGTASQSETIAVPSWSGGNRYLGFWVEGQRAIGEVAIAGVNRRPQYDVSQVTVDNVAGTLFTSKQPLTEAYSGAEATVR